MLKRIRSYFSILILVLVLVKSFKKGLKEVLFKEEKEPEYLAQKDFESCYDRARAIISKAIEKPLRILSYAICIHREKFHGENHRDEKIVLGRDMTNTEIKTASRGWWLL